MLNITDIEIEMNILHVILNDFYGGSERYCADLAALQMQAGHNVKVAIAPQNQRGAMTQYLDAEVERIEIPRLFRNRFLRNLIQKEGYDIIHAHLGDAAKLCAGLPVAKVASLHIRYQARRYRKYDGLICVAPYQMQELADYDGHKIVIPNWLPRLSEPDEARMAQIKARHQLAEDAFIFGFVGRLTKSKGVDVLIEAFERFDQPHTHLMIIGDGDENVRAYVEQAVVRNPYIIWAGTQTDVENYYPLFDCFISASRYEPFGLVLAEAMSFGCPIISTRTEGPLSFLPEQANLVDIEDVAGMAAAMQQVYNEGKKKLIYDLGALDGAAQAQKIVDFYRTVIEGKAAI